MQSPADRPKFDDVVQLCNESVILQALTLRQSFENENDFIVALSRAGFENARIATLVGKSTAAVRSAVNRAKKNRG